MKCITTAIAGTTATIAPRQSWYVQSAAARPQTRGERLDAWAHRLPVRWDCVDDVRDTVTVDVLSSR